MNNKTHFHVPVLSVVTSVIYFTNLREITESENL